MTARTLAPGTASGPALILDEPLSFWGGMDPATGEIIDHHHPQIGRILAGAVLVMSSGRGSSSSSSVLAEAIRAGVAPIAILLQEPDAIVTLGSVVAAELYGIEVPVVILDAEAHASIVTGAWVSVRAAPGSAEVSVEAPR